MLLKKWTEVEYDILRKAIMDYLKENPMSYRNLAREMKIHPNTLLSFINGQFPIEPKTKLILMKFVSKKCDKSVVEKLREKF